MERVYGLEVLNGAQKSFNGKAQVIKTVDNATLLYSFNTLVAQVTPKGECRVYNLQSNTTVKHVKEFLLQEGFKADNKKQIEADYYKG